MIPQSVQGYLFNRISVLWPRSPPPSLEGPGSSLLRPQSWFGNMEGPESLKWDLYSHYWSHFRPPFKISLFTIKSVGNLLRPKVSCLSLLISLAEPQISLRRSQTSSSRLQIGVSAWYQPSHTQDCQSSLPTSHQPVDNLKWSFKSMGHQWLQHLSQN